MRALIWVFGIVALLFFGVYLVKDNIRNWFFPNIVALQTYGDAQRSQVQIKWTAEGERDTLLIYTEGKQTGEEFRAKGYNYFMLYYRDELLATFDQFKDMTNSGHKYEFILWQSEDSIQTDLRIIGPEAR